MEQFSDADPRELAEQLIREEIASQRLAHKDCVSAEAFVGLNAAVRLLGWTISHLRYENKISDRDLREMLASTHDEVKGWRGLRFEAIIHGVANADEVIDKYVYQAYNLVFPEDAEDK